MLPLNQLRGYSTTVLLWKKNSFVHLLFFSKVASDPTLYCGGYERSIGIHHKVLESKKHWWGSPFASHRSYEILCQKMELNSDLKNNTPVRGQEQIMQDVLSSRLFNMHALINDAKTLAGYGEWHVRPRHQSLESFLGERDPCKVTCNCSKCITLIENCVIPMKRHNSEQQTIDFWSTLKEQIKPPVKVEQASNTNNFWDNLKERLKSKIPMPSEIWRHFLLFKLA